jgi:Tol biopolymer transport system component
MTDPLAKPAPEEVRAELKRVLTAPTFVSAERLSALLRFIVEETLAGRSNELKEYTLGVEVFERGADFAPKIDPIVRVSAGKLRHKLLEYYEGPGAHDGVRISVPKGSYVPVFAGARALARSRTHRWSYPALLSGVLLAGGIGIYFVKTRSSGAIGRQPVIRLTSDAGLTSYPALSRDGRMLAYTSDRSGNGNLDLWVQQVTGGSALQRTWSRENEDSPDFSPDGTQIAFRSEREGGGIYVIGTLGGEARRVVAAGRNPRWSPNGKRIAYWEGPTMTLPGSSHTGRIFTVVMGDGNPHPLAADFSTARDPVWSPDGRALMFQGRREDWGSVEASFDWWVAPMDGTPPVRTGAFEALRKAGFGITVGNVGAPGAWVGDRVVFSGRMGDSVNLWRIGISAKTYRVTGDLERLTFGTGTEQFPSVAGERIAFASAQPNFDIWSVPLNADRGVVTGPAEQLTRDPSHETWPTLSADGRQMAYFGPRPGNRVEVLTKQVPDGAAQAVITEGSPLFPMLSPDGTRILYVMEENKQRIAYLFTIASGVRRIIADNCFLFFDWTADGRAIAAITTDRQRAVLVNVESGVQREIARGGTLSYARLSPDGKSVVLGRAEGGRLRFSMARTDEPGEFPVIEGNGNDVAVGWSPDGSLLYFLLQRDGNRCLWAQRVEPTKRHLVGEAFAVQHFHKMTQAFIRLSTGRVIGGGRFVYSSSESPSNVWMTTVK